MRAGVLRLGMAHPGDVSALEGLIREGAAHAREIVAVINAQRHIRGAVGGLVAGVIGDTRIFVSGGAEHQGPDGGGLIAVIAERAATSGSPSCAS
jgi:amidohydrolase ring-opening protein AtzD/TrzD